MQRERLQLPPSGRLGAADSPVGVSAPQADGGFDLDAYLLKQAALPLVGPFSAAGAILQVRLR